MNRALIFITCVFFSSCIAQKINLIKIEKGVSEQLAEHRLRVLRDVNYTLHFNIPINRQELINSSEIISFTLKENKEPLQVDFKEERDHLKDISVNGKTILINFINEHIVVDPKHLKIGKNEIAIKFIAGELSLNRNEEYLYTLLVPDRSRTLFPCFDQPGIKARFLLSLTVPKDWQAMANAPLSDSSLNANTKTYNYKQSDLFSTYLFSFVAGKYNKATKDVVGREMNFYFRETDPGKIRLSMDTVFGWHGKALSFLEDYTTIKYPFQKFDFAAIPDFQYGGMEHVGAIDYKASTLFLDSGATRDQENARSNLIAHETAHMWFGDLVTMRWFNDVWMKEVFANFIADKITRDTGRSYDLKFLLTHFPRAYSIDRTAGANPIRQPLNNLQEAGTLYGPVIYNKAPVMMRQLERLMGEQPFRDGVREYLQKYSYSIATWPQLIEILDKRTPEDLQAWNQVWVNTPGRPHIDFELEQKNDIITKLTFKQKGERTAGYVLPQIFEIEFVYADSSVQHTVHINKAIVDVNGVKGSKVPSLIIFNSSGQGYGVFPVHQNTFSHFHLIQDPVVRGSVIINLYENMLNGTGPKPVELLTFYFSLLSKDEEELNLSAVTGQINDIYWRLIRAEQRAQLVPLIEQNLWSAMQSQSAPNKKKLLFKSYQSVALTAKALDTLYNIWKEQSPPAGVKLTEEDYTSLALNLAVKDYSDSILINKQIARINNPDRKLRLQFLKPALSADVKVRDHFFNSLKDQSIRKKESWVQEALSYLHHPLRAETSVKYLKESLEMLQEIQLTGDIFFPAGWLNATFSNYHSKQAADIVRNFLAAHPGYNPRLKMKILQAVDPLFRAEKLVK